MKEKKTIIKFIDSLTFFSSDTSISHFGQKKCITGTKNITGLERMCISSTLENECASNLGLI